MLRLLDFISDETRTAFYKELLEGLMASEEVSDKDKEKLKDFGSITFTEIEAEREDYGFESISRSEIIYTLYGEFKDVKNSRGETVSMRDSVTIKEDALVTAY